MLLGKDHDPNWKPDRAVIDRNRAQVATARQWMARTAKLLVLPEDKIALQRKAARPAASAKPRQSAPEPQWGVGSPAYVAALKEAERQRQAQAAEAARVQAAAEAARRRAEAQASWNRTFERLGWSS